MMFIHGPFFLIITAMLTLVILIITEIVCLHIFSNSKETLENCYETGAVRSNEFKSLLTKFACELKEKAVPRSLSSGRV